LAKTLALDKTVLLFDIPLPFDETVYLFSVKHLFLDKTFYPLLAKPLHFHETFYLFLFKHLLFNKMFLTKPPSFGRTFISS